MFGFTGDDFFWGSFSLRLLLEECSCYSFRIRGQYRECKVKGLTGSHFPRVHFDLYLARPCSTEWLPICTRSPRGKRGKGED